MWTSMLLSAWALLVSSLMRPPEERAKALLQEAVSAQIGPHRTSQPVKAFSLDLDVVDSREGKNSKLRFTLLYQASEQSPLVDKIKTRIREGSQGETAYDGQDYWYSDVKNPRPTRMNAAEWEQGKQELRRRRKLCRTLTRIFSLQGLEQHLEDVTLVGEGIERIGFDGKPQRWGFVLEATSEDVGSLLEQRKDLGKESPPKARLALYFNEAKILQRIDVFTYDPDHKRIVDYWESYVFPAYQPAKDVNGNWFNIPRGFLVYQSLPKAMETSHPAFTANFSLVSLNPVFEPEAFHTREELRKRDW